MKNESIAIIGMSGMFPGSNSEEEFWSNIVEKKEMIKDFSIEELRETGVKEEILKKKNYVKRGTVLEGAKEFDADFFGYTPREAEIMDPQHRKFLEVSWKAFESAGYSTEKIAKDINVGVFAGSTMNTYILNNLVENKEIMSYMGDQQIMVGNDKDYLTSRVSYKLNLSGPSIATQTACSSSIYAIHLACQSLLVGDSDMCIAGGASIRLPLNEGYMYYPEGTSSKDGHCYAFDARANGSVSGSGVAAIVLKKLEKAIEENDNIIAVIKATSVGNDGGNKGGFSAPSAIGQEKVIAKAIKKANIPVESIKYVEAHGTATQIGDPIEFTALSNAFSKFTDKKSFIYLGSVKTNVGHLDAAAGMAGLFKVIYAMKNKLIPSNATFEKVNPNLKIDDSPFSINKESLKWDADVYPRRAGINSIGMGGNNSFIILEEFNMKKNKDRKQKNYLIPVSAKTDEALAILKKSYQNVLATMNSHDISNLSYTSQLGRNDFSKRSVYLYKGEERKSYDIKNLCPLQGTTELLLLSDSNYYKMGEQLFKEVPVLYTILKNKVEQLQKMTNLKTDTLFKRSDSSSYTNENIADKQIKQLLIYTSIHDFLLELGIKFDSIKGENETEFIKDVIEGKLTIIQAAKIIQMRAKYLNYDNCLGINCRNKEEMDEIKKIAKEHHAEIIHQNKNIVILKKSSGELEQLENLLSELNFDMKKIFGKTSIKANKKKAFISKLKEEFQFTDEYITLISEREISNSVPSIAGDPAVILVLGKNQLFNYESIKEQQIPTLALMDGSPKKEYEQLLHFIANMWLNKTKINWYPLWEGSSGKRVAAPTYPFAKTTFWIEKPNRKKENLSHSVLVDTNESKKSETKKIEESGRKDDSLSIKESLILIWEKYMGISSVDPEADFFDLGGHSLLAAQIISEIQEMYAVDLSIEDFLENNSISLMEKLILKKIDNLETQAINMVRNEEGMERNHKEFLLDLWKKYTGIKEIGLKEDIFELGGHSLMVTQIISEINDVYDIQLSISDFIEDACVEGISDLLETKLLERG